MQSKEHGKSSSVWSGTWDHVIPNGNPVPYYGLKSLRSNLGRWSTWIQFTRMVMKSPQKLEWWNFNVLCSNCGFWPERYNKLVLVSRHWKVFHQLICDWQLLTILHWFIDFWDWIGHFPVRLTECDCLSLLFAWTFIPTPEGLSRPLTSI